MSTAVRIPSNYRLSMSAKAIAEAADRLATEITPWADQVAKQTGKEVLAIPLLNGGMFFFADLVRKLGCSIEDSTARLQAYELGANAVQNQKVKISLELDLCRGRTVLLVDDICDSGRSLKALQEELKTIGVTEVKTVVLINREHEAQVFVPDWVGFRYPGPEWFVGYGMDDRGSWRNLPEIYVIEKGQ